MTAPQKGVSPVLFAFPKHFLAHFLVHSLRVTTLPGGVVFLGRTFRCFALAIVSAFYGISILILPSRLDLFFGLTKAFGLRSRVGLAKGFGSHQWRMDRVIHDS